MSKIMSRFLIAFVIMEVIFILICLVSVFPVFVRDSPPKPGPPDGLSWTTRCPPWPGHQAAPAGHHPWPPYCLLSPVTGQPWHQTPVTCDPLVVTSPHLSPVYPDYLALYSPPQHWLEYSISKHFPYIILSPCHQNRLPQRRDTVLK